MDLSKIGIIGTSKKEDERRVPIHPEHLRRLPKHIHKKLIFEKGYGKPSILKMMKLQSKREEWLQGQRYYQI